MDKTNSSLEHECSPMDIDEPVLDSTFKIDGQSQCDVSMQEVDLGNEHEAVSSQPSFTQIENIDHNLSNIINITNPFTPHIIAPEITNITQPLNTLNDPVNQNFNIPQNQIINGNFEVNPMPVVNNATSNGNIIQEIANACEDIEISNQMIYSLNAPEDISNLKVFKDSIEPDSLQTDSLIISAESVLNEAFNISTDSLEIPCKISNVQKHDIECANRKSISAVETVNKLSTTDLPFDIDIAKSKTILTVPTDFNKASNVLHSINSNKISNTTLATESVDSINSDLAVKCAKTEPSKTPNFLNSTTVMVESGGIECKNISSALNSTTLTVESVETVLNLTTTPVESALTNSTICNTINSTLLTMESAESDSKKNTNATTLTMESATTIFNEASNVVTSSGVEFAKTPNSTFEFLSVTSSNPEILHTVETSEIVSENVSSFTQDISLSKETNSNLEILENHPDTAKASNTVLNISNKDLPNNSVETNFELKNLNPAISSISLTEKNTSESGTLVEKVIHSLEACNIPDTTESEKLVYSLEPCKILPESEKLVSLLDSCKISHESQKPESESLLQSKIHDSKNLEYCKILDSELNAELAIVPSGVTIATPKKLIIESTKTILVDSLLKHSQAVEDYKTGLLTSEVINKSPNKVAEIDKPAVLSKDSVFTNISRAANILIESPKKLVELINKKSHKENIVPNQRNSPDLLTNLEKGSETSNNSNSISINSPVKLFDILNQNDNCSSQIQNSNSESSKIALEISESVAPSPSLSSGLVETAHSDACIKPLDILHENASIRIVDSELLGGKTPQNSISVLNLDHSSEVSIDKRKLVEMSRFKNLDQVSEVSSSNENISILKSSSSDYLDNPPEISQENLQISLNFAGPDSKTNAFESNTHVLTKTGDLQNTVQLVSKTPVGKTIPLNLDQLSGCISKDSSKPIVKPELVKRSSTSEYAVAPDFDVKEQEVAMKRGSFSEDLVESEKKFSVHDASADNTALVGKTDGVLNKALTLDAGDILNTTDTVESEKVDSANGVERILNTTNTMILDNLNTTNTLKDNLFSTTNTAISSNLNSTITVGENALNITNTLIPANSETTNAIDENVLNTTNTVITQNLNSLEENILNTSNPVKSENTDESVFNTKNNIECLLNSTKILTPGNLNTTKTVESVVTTPNTVSIEDVFNTTNTTIAEKIMSTTNKISAGNGLIVINTIQDNLNTTVETQQSLNTSSHLNVTNSTIANQECLNITANITNPTSCILNVTNPLIATNIENLTSAKILDISNTEDRDTGVNISKDTSGSTLSESNVSGENSFNSTVILCDEKLNSTQLSTAQSDEPKRQGTDSYITSLVGEMVESSVDNSEIKTLPLVKAQEVACDTKILSELQFDKSFDEKAGLNKSQIHKKRNSPLKLFPSSILPNDEATVAFDGVCSPKRVDLPQIHKIISPVLAVKSCENLKNVQSLKLNTEEKGNACSPKITLKSVTRMSDKFVSSNTEKSMCSNEPLDDTMELGNNTLLMSSTKVSEDSFNAVCTNNNPENQDGLVCDSLKSQKTVLVKDSQLVLVEDRSPFKKINSNWKDSKVKKVEETIMPDVVMKVEEVNEAKISYENKENFNLSIFSNSPAKPKSTNRRDTLFRLFDPLYDSRSPDTTISSNSPQSIEKNETISNKVSSSLISINEGPNAADIALISCNKIKEDLSDERDIETFLEALPETLHSFKAKMEDAIDERMKMEQELNELKLELNQLQQERTGLQLELHQKEEVILKIQGEAQKLGNQYKQEIKQLQDKLNTINEQNNNEEVKILREEISKLKDRDAQLNEKISKLVDQIAALENTVHNYETTLDRVIKESEKLRVEHDNTKKHLATLEVSFSDVHAKYERTKEFVVAYKNNEEVLSDKLEKCEEIARRYEERYETLKAHAKAQIDKANKELSTMKEKHQIELNKMTALLRRLEIKTGSIQQALDQKTKECAALASLCDEMAGSVPQ